MQKKWLKRRLKEIMMNTKIRLRKDSRENILLFKEIKLKKSIGCNHGSGSSKCENYTCE
jgi:hypothetical protein